MNETKHNQPHATTPFSRGEGKKRSLWTRIFSICGFSLAALYIVFSLYSFSSKNRKTVCNEMEMIFPDNDKISLINEDDIERLLKAKNMYPVGKALKDIQTEAIENVLNTNEMVKSAECYATPSGKIHLRIKQRTPKFRVMGTENYYIDTEKNRIRTSTSYTAYLPIVSGHVNFETATEELFDFITFLEKNAFWNAQIEQIYIRADKKIELVPRVGDNIILLGTLDNYPAKLEKLRKLYLKGFNEIGWNRYKTIDLQYNGQVVCTK